MTALQTTETVYRLFHWKSGTYEFEPGDVEWDRETVTPLRAESVLMEGFRQVDEWPLVRRQDLLDRDDVRADARARAASARRSKVDKKERRRVDASFDGIGDEPEPKKRRVRVAREERAALLRARGARGARVEKIVDLVAPRRVRDVQGAPQPGEPRVPQGRSPPANRAAAAVGAYAQDWQARIRRGATRVVATVADRRGARRDRVLGRPARPRLRRQRRRPPCATTPRSASSPATRWSGCAARSRCTGSSAASTRTRLGAARRGGARERRATSATRGRRAVLLPAQARGAVRAPASGGVSGAVPPARAGYRPGCRGSRMRLPRASSPLTTSRREARGEPSTPH